MLSCIQSPSIYASYRSQILQMLTINLNHGAYFMIISTLYTMMPWDCSCELYTNLLVVGFLNFVYGMDSITYMMIIKLIALDRDVLQLTHQYK